jgi:hypothetical protein
LFSNEHNSDSVDSLDYLEKEPVKVPQPTAEAMEIDIDASDIKDVRGESHQWFLNINFDKLF